MQKSAGKYLADDKSWNSFHNGSVNEHHFFLLEPHYNLTQYFIWCPNSSVYAHLRISNRQRKIFIHCLNVNIWGFPNQDLIAVIYQHVGKQLYSQIASRQRTAWASHCAFCVQHRSLFSSGFHLFVLGLPVLFGKSLAVFEDVFPSVTWLLYLCWVTSAAGFWSCEQMDICHCVTWVWHNTSTEWQRVASDSRVCNNLQSDFNIRLTNSFLLFFLLPSLFWDSFYVL